MRWWQKWQPRRRWQGVSRMASFCRVISAWIFFLSDNSLVGGWGIVLVFSRFACLAVLARLLYQPIFFSSAPKFGLHDVIAWPNWWHMCEIETTLVVLSTVFALAEVVLKQCWKFEAFDWVLMALICMWVRCGYECLFDFQALIWEASLTYLILYYS